MILDWLGYQLVMRFDAAINPYTRFGKWCLPRAGRWAYRNQTPH